MQLNQFCCLHVCLNDLIRLSVIGCYIYSFFFSNAHTHFKSFASLFQNKSNNYTHKLQNASHLLQNEALHLKFHRHLKSKHLSYVANTFV